MSLTHTSVGIEFDPHQTKPGNVITDEAVVVTGTKYRVLIPAKAPFYTNSVVVKCKNAELKLGTDYIITHQYVTGVLRTGRVTHGMIWLLNGAYTDGFTVTYHTLGIGHATAQQIAAERESNKNVYPYKCQWEQVIGDVYFPPVDIQFDRANWHGELELMKAIVGTIKKPDAFLDNESYWKGPLWPDTEESTKNYKLINDNRYGPLASGPWGLFRPMWRCYTSARLAFSTRGFKGYDTALPFGAIFSYPSADKLGSPTATDRVSLEFQIKSGTAADNRYTLNLVGYTEQSRTPFSETVVLPQLRESNVVNSYLEVEPARITFILEVDSREVARRAIDANTVNSAEYTNWFNKIIKADARLIGFRGNFSQVDYLDMISVPNQRTDLGDVFEVIRHWKATVAKLFHESPAQAHVANMQNPHAASYGPSRAIERNGIASDSVNAYGGNESQLANFINARHPTQADLLLKILRAGSVARQMTGKIVTHPGVTSFATTVDPITASRYLGKGADFWKEQFDKNKIEYKGDNTYQAKTHSGVSIVVRNVPTAEQNLRVRVSGVNLSSANNVICAIYARWYVNAGIETGNYATVEFSLWGGSLMAKLSYSKGSGTIPEFRAMEKNISADFPVGQSFTFDMSLRRTANRFEFSIQSPVKTYTATLDLDAPSAELTAFLNTNQVKPFLLRPMLDSCQVSSQSISNTMELLEFPGTDLGNKTLCGAQFQVDPKALRVLGINSTRFGAVNANSTLQAGNNVLLLTKEGVLTWNNKVLLDPTTVGPYLPGSNGDAGEGIFYGTNSSTVTVTGNGIKNVPFICTFAPKQNVDLFTPAPRMVTSDYGDSSELAATPALITKLDAEFSGKLELAKAWINNIPLTGSVTIDKYSFGLTNVQNVSDAQMPISTLQKALFDEYSHVGHKHSASVFGIGAATTAALGVVKYGDLVDDATLALDGVNVVAQADKLATLDKDLSGLNTNVVIDIIRYGASGSGSAGTGSMTAFMATFAKSTYFVRKEYPVPAKSFNLLELYPTAHADAEFDVFVDLVGEAGEYSVAPINTVAENATRTKIGGIVTGTTAITSINVFNTTRLGNISELTEHAADVSAHFSKALTMKAFNVNYPKYNPCWTSGVSGLRRGLADWRAMGPYDWADMSTVRLTPTGDIMLQGVGINFNSNEWRSLVSMKPTAKPPQTTVSWAVSDNDSANSMLETVICGYRAKDGIYNRISIIVSRRKAMVDSNGNFCYVALGVNVGRTNYVLIGIPSTVMPDLPVGWNTLNPTIRFSSYYNPSELGDNRSFEAPISISLGGVTHTVILQMTATSKKIINAEGATHVEIDITDRFPAGFIDLSELTDGSAPLYTYGVGGVFDRYATATLSFVDGTDTTATVMDTTIDYFNNLSGLYRFVAEKDPTELGVNVTIEQMRNLFISRSFALRTLSPDNVPPARVRADLIASRDGFTNYCCHFKF